MTSLVDDETANCWDTEEEEKKVERDGKCQEFISRECFGLTVVMETTHSVPTN